MRISGLSFIEIVKSARWSNERKTFPHFFDRPVQSVYLGEICSFLYVYTMLLVQETHIWTKQYKTIMHEAILI